MTSVEETPSNPTEILGRLAYSTSLGADQRLLPAGQSGICLAQSSVHLKRFRSPTPSIDLSISIGPTAVHEYRFGLLTKLRQLTIAKISVAGHVQRPETDDRPGVGVIRIADATPAFQQSSRTVKVDVARVSLWSI